MAKKKKDVACDYDEQCKHAGTDECIDCERNYENWGIQDNFESKDSS